MDTQQHTLVVGEQFDTMQELHTFCKYAVDKNFKFLTKQADKTRYTINCNNMEGCTWCLYASIVKTKGQSHLVGIWTLTDQHTCIAMPDLRHKHASSSFVGSIIKAKLVDQLNYGPADIIHDMRHENGVNVGYISSQRESLGIHQQFPRSCLGSTPTILQRYPAHEPRKHCQTRSYRRLVSTHVSLLCCLRNGVCKLSSCAWTRWNTPQSKIYRCVTWRHL